MAIFTIIARTLVELWPFLKELVFKNTDLSVAIRQNKMVSIVFVSLLFSMVVVYYLGTLVVSESSQVKALTADKEQLELQVKLMQDAQESLERELGARDAENGRLVSSEEWLRSENERLYRRMAEMRVENRELLETNESLEERLDAEVPEPTHREDLTVNQRTRDRFQWLRGQEND